MANMPQPDRLRGMDSAPKLPHLLFELTALMRCAWAAMAMAMATEDPVPGSWQTLDDPTGFPHASF